MDNLCGISRSLYGQPWSSWCSTKELESEEETPEREQIPPGADVMRLPKEDMTLFGFCPEQDDFYIVICELCGLGIKPMGMNHHMNLRHSKGEEAAKNSTSNKSVNRECDAKPKNRKHASQASIVSEYGHGVGPPQKVLPSESVTVALSKTERHQETSQIRPPSNLKTSKLETEKIIKVSSTSKNHSKQYNTPDSNTVGRSSVNAKLPSVKSSRSSKVYNDSLKQSKTVYESIPIESGFWLQLVGSTNCIVVERKLKSVSNPETHKVRHRRKHSRSRTNHKAKLKSKISKKLLPVMLKKSMSFSPMIAQSPSRMPSPFVALMPLKYVKWNKNLEEVPSHLKPSISSHPSGGFGFHSGSMMPSSKASDGVMQVLTVDTSNNNVLKPELVPLLSCKSAAPLRNHLEVRLNQNIEAMVLQENKMLVPALMPHAPICVPDTAWSAVHPKSLGVCPLQIRKVGGLISTNRRLDCVWQYMKSALLEQEAYQTTVLCNAPSSQPDFHLNHNSSIKTILASLAANNYSRNSVCKPSNMGLRQFPLSINSEKPNSASLRSVIDVSSSVMLISSSHSKAISDPNSFLSHVTKVSPIVRRNPSNSTTQPYPGIFLRNGQHIFPKHLRICLKRRKPVQVINNVVKKLKEKSSEEKLDNCVSQNEFSVLKCSPILKYPGPNGLTEPANKYLSYPEGGFKQVVPQSEIELDVNSIGMITTNGESLCEATGRLSGLDKIKNDILSGFHMKSASRILDATNKSSCRKVSATQLPNVRISSAAGTVQVSTPQITYLTTGPVTFQQISPQMIGQIQLQSKSNQTSTSIPLKLISPAQTVSLTASRTMLLQQEKDES